MKVLITGATGFIGGYLAPFLVEKGAEVYGTYFLKPARGDVRFPDSIKLMRCDIRDRKTVDGLMDSIRPDQVYHLAAQSFAPLSWKKPVLTMNTNVIGTINLFEVALKQKPFPRVLVACSSAEYGFIDEGKLPINEDHPLRPLHPYGISKLVQELLAYQYYVNFHIPTIGVRIFNTTGPGPLHDVCSDFARRIAEAEAGLTSPIIKVGNLNTKRDFNDVRDTIRGLYLAQEKGKPWAVYNLCTGKAYSGSEILEILTSMAKIKLSIQVDPALLRPSDEPVFIGDSTRLRNQTGWGPTVPMEKTLKDMLDYWRNQYSSHKAT